MGPNMVTTQLNQFRKKTTNKDLHCRIINPILIRKMTTTAVHEKAPAQKRSVATIMNHDVRTAERDYLLQEKKKKVAATGAFV